MVENWNQQQEFPNYLVIEELTVKGLQESVNKQIQKNYQLAGSVFTHGPFICQPMVIEKEKVILHGQNS